MSTEKKAGLPGRLIALWKQLTPPQRATVIGVTVVACWFMGPLAPFLALVAWGWLRNRSVQPGANDLLKTVVNTLEGPPPPPKDAEARPRTRTARLRQPAAPPKAAPPPVVAQERTAVVPPPAADPFDAFTTPREPLTGFGSRGPNGFDEALAMLRGEDEPKGDDRR